MGDCGVCLMAVKNSPFGDENFGQPAPVVSKCGHVFHKYCWNHSVRDQPRCPKCRVRSNLNDAHPFYPDTETELLDLTEQVAAFRLENDHLKVERDVLAARLGEKGKKIEQLTEQVEVLEENRRRSDGARVVFDQYSDSTCFNCESKEHGTTSCPNAPIVKNKEIQADGNFNGRPYTFHCLMDGPSAGELVTKYQAKFGMTFSKIEVQVMFSFLFFDSCCWNCASPFHELKNCKNPQQEGIRKLAKLMHIEMHPLTDEEIQKRIEKCRVYGKR